jgi:pyridoxamine 5'-phosphate oxidase
VIQLSANSSAEICWWIDPSQEQFRILGRIYVIPDPSNPNYAKFLENVENGGRTLRELKAEGIDWENQRQELFNSMSSHMKASWVRPTPGSKLEDYEESKKWPSKVEGNAGDTPENPEEAKNLRIALANFALVLIDPVNVDYVEMGILPNRRTRWVREGDFEGIEWADHLEVP